MSAQSIPTIDVADPERAETCREIAEACREWGFFQAVGHGIDPRLMTTLQRQMRAFFAQPAEVKRKILRTAQNPWGFYDQELTRHTLDWKQIFDVGPPEGGVIVPQWPESLPAFKPAIEQFYDASNELALRILGAIALSLGVPARSLDGYFRPAHTCFLRLNYYPKCPMPDRHHGVNQHTDSGAVTVLLQDNQPGLEVFRDGAWHLVEPRADALVINIGDIVQVWSNDRYKAALHRAFVHPDADRFSVAFFLNPPYSADYAPLPSVIDARHPPLYRSINWGEFRARRTAGDYSHAGEYAQISQYYR